MSPAEKLSAVAGWLHVAAAAMLLPTFIAVFIAVATLPKFREGLKQSIAPAWRKREFKVIAGFLILFYAFILVQAVGTVLSALTR